MPLEKLDKDSIKELAELLKQNDLSEIEYEANGVKIRVARQMTVTSMLPQPSVVSANVAFSNDAPSMIDVAKHPGTIKSPMVGTVYLSPEPGASSFVKIVDSVNVGQNLLIIEAMKVMNTIKATKSGTVKQILVSDAEPVEFDSPLMIIE